MKKCLIAALLLLATTAAMAQSDPNYWDRESNVRQAVDDMKATYKRSGINGTVDSITRCYTSVRGEGLTPLSERCFAMDMAAYLQAVQDNRASKAAIPAFLNVGDIQVRSLSILAGYDFGSVRQYGEDITRMVMKEMQFQPAK